MGKEVVNQVQEEKRVPHRKNPRRNMRTHILIKLSKKKIQRKNIESCKGKATNNIEGNPHKVNS